MRIRTAREKKRKEVRGKERESEGERREGKKVRETPRERKRIKDIDTSFVPMLYLK